MSSAIEIVARTYAIEQPFLEKRFGLLEQQTEDE